MNIDTNRRFWHKEDALIGFIWVHLLSGRRGTHPSDPSLFIHLPLHNHVLLRHPPMIPTQPRLIMAGIIMTTATMAALETTECVGHRDSLSTYETAGWKKNKQLWVFLFWELLHKDVSYFCPVKVWSVVLWGNLSKHYILKKVTWSLVTNPVKMRLTCGLRAQTAGNQRSLAN